MSRPITFQNDSSPYLSGENLNKMQDELNPFRNMLNIPNGAYTHNGVTYIVKDGVFTYSGGTGTSDVNIGINITPFTLKAGTYTMSNNSGRYPYIFLYSGDTKVVGSEYANNGVKTFTIENETTINKIHLYFGQNTPPTSVKPQLEEGTGKTNYTPYTPTEIIPRIGNWGNSGFMQDYVGDLNNLLTSGWVITGTNATNTPGTGCWYILTMVKNPYYYVKQIAFARDSNQMWIRTKMSSDSFGAWVQVI